MKHIVEQIRFLNIQPGLAPIRHGPDIKVISRGKTYLEQ